jgi:hypothetical protein
MTKDKNKQVVSDQNKIAIEPDYEVQFLAENLGVTTEEVEEAIKSVGIDRQKLQSYLNSQL